MEPLTIRSQAEATEPIIIHIDDDEFKFVPPPAGAWLLLYAEMDEDNPQASTKEMMRFLLDLFEGDDAKRFRAKFKTLGSEEIVSLFNGLVEVVAARPTRSPTD